MDSDLSLLEIAGEDDSLLQIPRNDSGVNNASTIFSCSPLHFRSVSAHAPQTEGRVGAVVNEKLGSSHQDGINKENINGNKLEAPKLNVEPQQMKRKKKGGAYNLRKSLAWDRAFFTEEGVLNSLELSMISGNHSRNNNELTIIHEEEENALVGEGDIVGASSELQEIEENLFKQLSEDRKNGTCLLQKSYALTKDTLAPTSMAKRKVLAVNDIHRNRSKRNASPQQIASSSLKRPDTAKAQSKESKVSKIPVLKTHVPVITTSARSGASNTGHSKRHHNAQSAAYVLKNAGVKSLSKNLRSVPINAKFDVADKSSVTRTLTRRAGKDTDNSISKTHPPPRLQQKRVTETNKGFEVHPPLHVCSIGDKKQQRQFQTEKPSGLRMPSPSLGFFSQQKVSSSHSILNKSSKPCKTAESNICKLKKVVANCVYEARLPHPPGQSSETVNGAAKNCTANLSLSDVKSEPSLQVKNNQKAKVEVQCYSLRSGKIAEQEKFEKILEAVNKKSLEQVELCKSENVLNMEDMEFHTNDKNILLENNVGETKVDEDLFVFQEPQSMHYSSIQRALTENENLSKIAPNAIQQEVDVQTKPLTCDVQISNESLVLQAEHDSSSKDSRHSGEFEEYNCMKNLHENSSLRDFSETVLGTSLEGIPCKSTEEVKYGVNGFDEHGGDAPVHLLNGNLSVDCNTQVNGCLVHVTTLSSQESPKMSVEEIIGACRSESKLAAMEDCQNTGDVQAGFVHRRPDDNEYDQLIESKLIQDRTKASSKLDGMCEDIPVSTTACSTEVNNVSLERSFYENNIDRQHFTSQLRQIEQTNCGSRGNDMPVNNGCDIFELQFSDDTSSRGTSLHGDLLTVQHDVRGNLEQQARLLTSSKINYMLGENEISVVNHSHLLGESDSFEVYGNVDPDTRDNGEAETPSGLHEHKLLAEAIREPDFTVRVIESLHVKDAQVLSSDENPVTCSCDNNPSTSFAEGGFSLVVNSINKESPLELQRPSLVADVDFQQANRNGDLLPASNASSEKFKSENLFEGVLERGNDFASEYSNSKHHIQATSETKDESLDLDEREERLQMDGTDQVSAETVEVELNHKVNAANIVSSVQGNEDQIINEVERKCNRRCSLNESLKLQVADIQISHKRIPEGSETSSLKRKSLSEEAENSTSGKDEISNADIQNQDDSGEITYLKKSGTRRKQDVPTVITPQNAAPFSDEWLAAMEAAGEEILTMKGGAVQNSPPDKPQHEPGPWSPVRRKNQAIGPFDCTKYTNMNIPDS